MNFLELGQAVRRECGVAGEGPASMIGQFGFPAKIVRWLNEAYLELQGMQSCWRFMWVRQDLPLIAGKAAYSPTVDFGIKAKTWNADAMTLLRVADSLLAPYPIQYLTWPDFSPFTRYPLQPGMPQYFTERPDRSLQFYPTPDQAMTLQAEYWRTPVQMVDNTDVPLFPEEFHMILVWRAVMIYAGSDEAPVLFRSASAQYKMLLAALEQDQLEPVLFAEPWV